MKELANKTAFVTGSGRGLGHAIAQAIAKAGARVVIHDLTQTSVARIMEYELSMIRRSAENMRALGWMEE
jgi:NAD(P)-dependent dehydrogenase (short-subunit alcohol dehydrogenase family)